MRTRDLSILSGVLLLGVLGGIVVLGQESYGGEIEPPVTPPATAPVAAPAEEPADAASSPAIATVASAADKRTGSTPVQGWTTGVVKGDIQLAISVLNRITGISVVVEEARSEIGPGNTFTRKHRRIVPVEYESTRGTPTFEVADIPFSEYPYIVSVLAPGLNGSRSTITINEKTPLIDDLMLRITPPAPFSVLVRDQDAVPFAGLELLMMPVGEPAGRPNQVAVTDNFGSIVFDEVLAGDYQVFISASGQTLIPEQTITVQPGLAYTPSKVRGQQTAFTVPRGVPVQLHAHDRAGYGVPDVAVTATATDRIKLTEFKTTTNAGGRADFTHLAPGTWQVTLEKDGFQRADLQLTVRAGQEPIFREVPLIVRLR